MFLEANLQILPWKRDLQIPHLLTGCPSGITDKELSGPLDRLNAILSLLQPLDRYRATCAIGSAIGRALSRPISHPRTGGSPQPPRSKPLRGAQPRDSGAVVSQTPLKQARNKNAIETAILNRVLDRD